MCLSQLFSKRALEIFVKCFTKFLLHEIFVKCYTKKIFFETRKIIEIRSSEQKQEAIEGLPFTLT